MMMNKRQPTTFPKPFLAALFVAGAMTACDQTDPTAEKGPSPQPEASGEDYPLTTCVVSGEELGSMGDPVVIEHEGTTVKFCCKVCIPEFKENPEAYLAKLR